MFDAFHDEYKMEENEVIEICTFVRDDVLAPWSLSRRSTTVVKPELQGDDQGDLYEKYKHQRVRTMSNQDRQSSNIAGLMMSDVDLLKKKSNAPDVSRRQSLIHENKIKSGEDPYISNAEPFPLFINVALFSRYICTYMAFPCAFLVTLSIFRSNDEYLGLLDCIL